MATSTDIANTLVSMNTAITTLETTIKDFKKIQIPGQLDPDNPPFVSLLSIFDGIKHTWTQLTANNTEKNADIDAIVIRIQSTEKKVGKLLKKYPPQVLAPAQPALSPEEQIAQKAALRVISFNDANMLTSCFGNSHPCEIEFTKIVYQNAESAFQAQRYSDRPNFMEYFQKMDGKAAASNARFFTMTQKRSGEWDSIKVDVMMDVLRAKFGQNPDLKVKLMATKSAYLANHQPEPGQGDIFWADGFDGSGENMLGICLMKLRGEYGGTGVVETSIHTELFYQFRQSDWEKKCSRILSNSSSSSSSSSTDRSTNAANSAIANATQFQVQQALQTKCIVCKTEPTHINAAGKVYDYCGGQICKKFPGLNQ